MPAITAAVMLSTSVAVGIRSYSCRITRRTVPVQADEADGEHVDLGVDGDRGDLRTDRHHRARPSHLAERVGVTLVDEAAGRPGR